MSETIVEVGPVSKAFVPLWEHYNYPDMQHLVMHSGRGCAKTYSVCDFQDYTMSNAYCKWVCARPLETKLELTSWATFVLTTKRNGTFDDYDFVPSKSKIVHRRTGAEAHYIGLNNNPDNIKGIPNITFFWGDEVDKLSQLAMSTVIPTVLRGDDGYHLCIWTFNLRFDTDPVYRNFCRSSDKSVKIIKLTQADNPYFSTASQQAMEYAYKVDPERAAWEWGGELLGNSSESLIPMATVRASINLDVGNCNEWEVFAGIDIGATGDPTTCYITQGRKFITKQSWQEPDHIRLIDQLTAYLLKHSVDMAMVDGTGIGYTPAQMLAKSFGSARVLSINFGSGASRAGFANKRAEMLCDLRDAFTNGMSIPDDPEIIEELGAITVFKTASGKTQIEDKGEIRQRIGRSTNWVDAMGLTRAIQPRLKRHGSNDSGVVRLIMNAGKWNGN
jgi:hypothetical protein